MSDEIKKLLEKQKTAFEEFKKKSDEVAASKLSKKEVDVLLAESFDKVNKDVGDCQKSIDELLKQKGRLDAAGGTGTVEEAEYKEAFDGFMRKGADTDLAGLQQKTMTVGSDPDGGIFVPSETEKGIDGMLRANSAIMGLARNVTIGGNSYKKRVRTSGAGYGWAGETETPSETSTPQYGQLEFRVGKIWAEPQISSDLLEDAEINIEAELQNEVELDMSEGVAEAVMIGSGVKKPKGLLAYEIVANASWEWGKLGYVASGASGAFATDKPTDQLIDLQHALKAGYRNNAVWVMNDLTLATVRKFRNDVDDLIWQPGITAGAPSLLLGKPVVSDDFVPDIATNSLSVIFGDIRRTYLVVNRRGIAILRDPYTAKPYVKYYTTKRIGGGIQHFESCKVMKFASS